MSNIFFEELEMPNPDIYLGVGSETHAKQTAKIMIDFEQVCIDTLLGIHNLFNQYSNSDKEKIIERKQLIYKQKGE